MTMQQQQTRTALAEIPDRLESLRMGGTTTPDIQPIQTGLYNPTHLDHVTNVALSQEYTLSSAASPDEFVIRQRGRRFSTNWSPDMPISIRSPFQRTPTKLPLSGMILRSSPRKRLTMGSTPPDPTPLIASPAKICAKQQLWPGTPFVKKLRLNSDDNCPLAQRSMETPLPDLLRGMSQQQLIDLIVNGIVAGDSKIENTIRAQLPTPDIEPLEQELLHAKKNIFKSLPTSRLCKKTDSTAYSRAALHVSEFKRLIMLHTKQLYDSTNWDALLDYVIMAWPYVSSTPRWDSAVHNAVRRQSFKILSCHCMAALKYGGIHLGAERLHKLERNLPEWAKAYEDVLSCVNILNKTLTKGRTSL